jgi:hypothetical protein
METPKINRPSFDTQQIKTESPSVSTNPLHQPSPTSKRKISLLLLIPAIFVGLIAVIYSWNYLSVQSPMNTVLSADVRNKGVEVNTHYQNYISPSVLIYDLKNISGNNSKADVFRVLLQYADQMKGNKFEKVILLFKGKPKFIIDGSYFQKLGEEYSFQNPVYTMNHFAENVYNLDGTPAFGTWTGGWLGVAGKQIEDFGEFHDQWYMNDLMK